MSLLWCGGAKSGATSTVELRQYKLESNNDALAGLEGRGVIAELEDMVGLMDFQPNVKDYHLLAVIGHGCKGAAVVSLARHIPTGSLVAVKRINLDTSPIEYAFLQREILMHRQLSHGNLISILCSFVHNNEVWVVMPLMAYGSCRDLLHAHFTEGLHEAAIAYVLKGALHALDYLHNRNIIHRGVRASHILISASGQVTLAGLRHAHSMLMDGRRCRVVHDFPEHYTDSLLWASPELLEQNLAGYDTKADVYSLGITACELANGIVPFCDVPLTQMLLEKLDGMTPQLLDSTTLTDGPEPNTSSVIQRDSGLEESECSQSTHRPSTASRVSQNAYLRTFSPHFHHFVQLCLQSDPKLRPSASSLLQHSFFRQVRRKSTMDSLPDLLMPVSPISNTSDLPTDDSAMEDMTTELADFDMDGALWEF